MKQLLIAAVFTSSIMLLHGCDNDSRYVDPNTGEALNLKEDAKSGLMVNAETGESVGIYVDTRTNDTINGRTGKVINGSIRKMMMVLMSISWKMKMLMQLNPVMPKFSMKMANTKLKMVITRKK